MPSTGSPVPVLLLKRESLSTSSGPLCEHRPRRPDGARRFETSSPSSRLFRTSGGSFQLSGRLLLLLRSIGMSVIHSRCPGKVAIITGMPKIITVLSLRFVATALLIIIPGHLGLLYCRNLSHVTSSKFHQDVLQGQTRASRRCLWMSLHGTCAREALLPVSLDTCRRMVPRVGRLSKRMLLFRQPHSCFWKRVPSSRDRRRPPWEAP